MDLGTPPLLSSVTFPVLIAPQESQRGLYVRFYLWSRTGGKLIEAWTREEAHLSFSWGCSEHIKGNISNVQNKWRHVKTPKDFPTLATLSCCHKSQDPCAHSCTQTEEEKLSRASFPPHGYSVTVTRRLFISTLNSKRALLVVSLPKVFVRHTHWTVRGKVRAIILHCLSGEYFSCLQWQSVCNYMIWIKTNGVCVKHGSNGITLIEMHHYWEQRALARYPTTGACGLPVESEGGWYTVNCIFSLCSNAVILQVIF